MHARGPEDARLVAASRAGDPTAFPALFEHWFDPCTDVAWRILRDREAAADVAQETFLAAWRGLGDLREPAAFGGWVLRTARNRALNRLERERRAVATGDDEVSAVLDADAPDDEPGTAAARGENAELVWAASAALGERDASVLDLHLRHGLAVPEIAESLGVTVNNAHQMLFRLRKRLSGAIRAWVLWRDGDPACPDLATAVQDGGVTRFGADAVRVISRHVPECEDCDARQQLRLAPEALFAAIPVVPAGAVLRARAATALQAEGVPVDPSPSSLASSDAGDPPGATGPDGSGADGVAGLKQPGADGVAGLKDPGVDGVAGLKQPGADGVAGLKDPGAGGVAGLKQPGADGVVGLKDPGVDGVAGLKQPGVEVGAGLKDPDPAFKGPGGDAGPEVKGPGGEPPAAAEGPATGGATGAAEKVQPRHATKKKAGAPRARLLAGLGVLLPLLLVLGAVALRARSGGDETVELSRIPGATTGTDDDGSPTTTRPVTPKDEPAEVDPGGVPTTVAPDGSSGDREPPATPTGDPPAPEADDPPAPEPDPGSAPPSPPPPENPPPDDPPPAEPADRPVVVRFVATQVQPQRICAHTQHQVTLTWSTQNADAVTVTGPGAPAGEHPASGQATACFNDRPPVTYTLAATGPGGVTRASDTT